MKNLSYLCLTLFLFAACQSEPTKTAQSPGRGRTFDDEKTLVVPWTVQVNDSTQAMEIRRDPAADMRHLEPADIVDALNLKYPQIILRWVRLEDSKAFVTVDDASYLTQQAGSQGAKAYLAEATYSLTELKGIQAVSFTFKEGDHARPGIYARQDFEF